MRSWLAVMAVWLAVADCLAAGPLTVAPGGIARWPGAGIVSCSLSDSSWTPVGDACWYPVDLLTDPGELVLERSTAAGAERITVLVGRYPYPTQELTVEPRMVNPDESSLARIEAENRAIAALWERSGPVRFSLPLGPPLAELPAGSSFGKRRVFNGEARSPHSGVDFPAASGAPVLAVADGIVALAAAHYFAGNSVFIDHGGGLVSMCFHLDTVAVRDGQQVERGQVIGTVGATGRATGPHLHFGLRWHGARVDPLLLIGSTARVTSIE